MVKINFFYNLPSSFYPYTLPLILVFIFTSFLVFFKFNFYINIIFSLIIFFIHLLIWLKDIFLEGLIGNHSFFLQDGFKICFYYFLLREVIFFFRFFWFLFDRVLVPVRELGEFWVPLGLQMVNPFGVPFLNSLILLRRAVRLTWRHFNFLEKKRFNSSLIFTIILGFLFILVQIIEYKFRDFNLRDGIFGSLFFIITGFHGLHVFLGLLFLILNFFRLFNNYLDNLHHLRFEFSIIYWHFVDIIWLFLYLFLYWWSF